MNLKDKILSFTGKDEYHFGDIFSATLQKTGHKIETANKRKLDIKIGVDELKNPLKTGWIFKQGDLRKNWKKRFFVLSQDFKLFYFHGEGEKEAAGVIYLEDSKIREASFEETEQTFSIKIETPSRDWFLYFKNQTDFNQWFTILDEQQQKKIFKKKQQLKEEENNNKFIIAGICCQECLLDLALALKKNGIAKEKYHYDKESMILTIKTKINSLERLFSEFNACGFQIKETK